MPAPPDVWARIAPANAVFVGVFSLGFLVSTVAFGTFPFDSLNYLIGRDFLNVWTAGRAAYSDQPGRFYDFDAYMTYLRATFGPQFPVHNWSYPPVIFFLAAPFGLIGYLPALLLWSVGGWGLFAWAALRRDWRPDGSPGAPPNFPLQAARNWAWSDFILVALSPAALMNLYAGQNGFLTAALMIGVFACLDKRPRAAGVLLGLLIFKPQLGVLFPLMLVLTRRWLVFVTAAATAAGLMGLTAAVFGTAVWEAYWREGMPMQLYVLRTVAGIVPPMMPTAFMNARVLDLPWTIASYVQAPFSLFALFAVLWTFRRRRDPVLSAAALVLATFVFSPYVFNYDMVVTAWVVLLLREHVRPGSAGVAWLVALWALPVLTVLAGVVLVPGSALVPAGCLAYVLLRLALLERRERQAPESGARCFPAAAEPARA